MTILLFNKTISNNHTHILKFILNFKKKKKSLKLKMNQNNVPSYYQQQLPGQQPLINMNIPMNQSPQIMNQQQQQNFPQIQPTNISGSSQISNGQFKSIDINFSNANVENKQIDSSLIVSFQNEFISDEIQDPVTKCKDLFPVLKSSIQVKL